MRDAESNGSGNEPAEADHAEWTAEIVVIPKQGVNDPEGTAILNGLVALGYDHVSRVRAGRYFEVVLTANNAGTAATAVEQMCDRLIANPVIEAYRYALRPAGDPEQVAARDPKL